MVEAEQGSLSLSFVPMFCCDVSEQDEQMLRKLAPDPLGFHPLEEALPRVTFHSQCQKMGQAHPFPPT